MPNLTKRVVPRNAVVCLGLSSLCVVALLSACSSSDSGPTYAMGGGGGGHAGSGAGTPSGGSAGAAGAVSSAGSMNHAGSGGSAGSVATTGGAGMGGMAGSGGVSGGAGTAGSGGSGGVACAADDKCCDDPAKTDPGMCGCGVPDADDDKDGLLNCKEQCPADPNKTAPGMCGCGLTENDSDDDGTIDCKPGHFLEAEDGVLSHVDVVVTPNGGSGGGGGVAGSGGAAGTGGAAGSGGTAGDSGGGGTAGDSGSGGVAGNAGGTAGNGGGGAAALPEVFTIGDDAKASKGKYLESPAGFTSDGLPGPARATYMVNIPVAGNYAFWGRFWAPSRDHNRLWVKVDDGIWTKLRVTTGETWFWYVFTKEGDFANPIAYTLTKGTHTLAIASDSDGVRVDRWYVSPSSDRPLGDTTLCNPPHTIQVGDVCQSSCGMLQGNSCDAVMCAGKTPLPAYDCAVCCTL
jgi:hypothetical protein